MLPSKYIISQKCDRSLTLRSHVPPQNLYHQQSPPPLGITGVICTSKMIDLPNQRGKLHCTIYRPRMLESVSPPTSASTSRTSNNNHIVPKLPKPNPPLICVAGGPGMSCQYLTGLVHLIPDRAVILYDHYNCGQSTATGNSICYDSTAIQSDIDTTTGSSVDGNDESKTCSFLNDTVNDLATLIESIIPINTSFHLFGHSMGGIIVYEYLKKIAINQQNQRMPFENSASNNTVLGISHGGGRICRSCILASTPSNIKESYKSKEKLISSILEELQETGYEKIPKRPSMNGDKDDDDDDDDDDEIDCGDNHLNDDETQQQQLRQAAHTVFQQRHECRTIPLPLSLQQSLTSLSNSTKKSGHRMKVRNQHQTNRQCTTSDIHPASFNQYIASPSISLSPIAVQLPPALILRGQYDFVTESNCRRWEDIYHICGLGNHCRYITITNCSHYGFLEEETLYGNVVLSFLHDHDGTNNVVKRFDNV